MTTNTPSTEDLGTHIERLVIEHIAASWRAAQEAVDRGSGGMHEARSSGHPARARRR